MQIGCRNVILTYAVGACQQVQNDPCPKIWITHPAMCPVQPTTMANVHERPSLRTIIFN